MNKLLKIIHFLENKLINIINYFNNEVYMDKKCKYLRKIGIKLNGQPNYIDPSVYFDGTNYNLIKIGTKTTISRDVLFLTHDFSINRGLYLLGYSERGKFEKSILIGNNCFIGARVILLPGTTIGDNVIIGAGSVVKGNIKSNCIAFGNPCKVVSDIKKWTNKHYELKDYKIL